MPRTRTELSYKEQQFVKSYVKNKGNGTKAVLEAYETDKVNIASAMASHKLAKSKIQKAIKELTESIDPSTITKENAILNMSKIAFTDENKANRIKATETMGKLAGWMIDKREDVTPQNVAVEAKDLENVSTEQLLSTLTARLKLSNAGIKPKTDDNSVTVSTPDAQNDALSRVSMKSDSENVDKLGGGVQTCGSRTPSIEGKHD